MDPEAGVGCFCLRRVNPFLGVVAVVRTADGRALSVDGRHWQIQVLAAAGSGTRGGEREGARYYRFGYWSAADGLERVPLNPMLDARRMVACAHRTIEQVRAHADLLPFPLAGELEQWLLDPAGIPLALIATALDEDELDRSAVSDWSAGGRGEERPFRSPSLAGQGVPERDGSGRRYHPEAIEGLIARAAGRPRAAQWFRREGDRVIGLDRGSPPGLAGRVLPRSDFPPLTLRTDWGDPERQVLVGEYVAWLAPYLLALPGLPEETRRGLERAAARHAPLVDALWRLYPRIVDPGLLGRVRVEARIRRAAG